MKAIHLLPAALLLFAAASCKKDDDNNAQTLSDTDRVFMTNASYSNNNETDAGSAASTMASMAMVKNFGVMMVSDHTKAQSDLSTVGTQVGKTDLPTTPDSMHVRMKAMLMTMSGRAFDSAYLKMQVTDHINTIALLQNEINNGSDQRVKNYATTQLPVVQMHKRMADSIVMMNGF